MKAIRLDQPQQFTRIEIPEPPAPAAGERRDVHVVPNFGTDFFSFNCRPTLPGGRPNPLADATVRRAFVRAVDRRALAERVVEVIQKTANTGKIGDGKIFVYDINSAVRIRTGETNADAL